MATVREWQALYEAGAYDAADVDVQRQAGWTDWICKDSQLPNKTKTMASIVTRLRDGGRVVLDECYVSFKNTQPDGGKAYDLMVVSGRSDIRYACSVDDERPSDGKKWHVYDYVDADGELAAGFDTVVQLAKWLNTPSKAARQATFVPPLGFTSESLRAEAQQDAYEKFGVQVEFYGIMRKYFRDGEQANIWLRSQLKHTEPGTILVAMYGKQALAGYTVNP